VNPEQETCTTVPGGPLVGVIFTEIDAYAGGIIAKAAIDAAMTNIVRIIAFSGFFTCRGCLLNIVFTTCCSMLR